MRRLLLLLVAVAVVVPAAPAAAQEPLPEQWRKGLNVTAFWYADLSGKRFDTFLARARTQARATDLTFVVSWFQYFSDPKRTDDLNAVEIKPSYGDARRCKGVSGRSNTRCKTPGMAQLRAAVRKAKAKGFRVAIRPQVDVGRTTARSKPRDLIDKGDGERQQWFDAYKRMLSQYTRLARDTGAQGLVVGSGLSAMTSDDADRNAWRAIVAEVRSGAIIGDGKGGFRGELSYAAQWDAVVEDSASTASQLSFWDVLDTITIDAYFPIAQGTPSEEQLRAGWTTFPTGGLKVPPVEIVKALKAEYDKPVRFSALGYLSRNGTAAFPEKGDGEQAAAGGKVSQGAQSRAIRAAFDVWAPIAAEGWFRGISWWEWPAAGDRGGPRDGGFSLQGKQALKEVCRRHAAGTGASC